MCNLGGKVISQIYIPIYNLSFMLSALRKRNQICTNTSSIKEYRICDSMLIFLKKWIMINHKINVPTSAINFLLNPTLDSDHFDSESVIQVYYKR